MVVATLVWSLTLPLAGTKLFAVTGTVTDGESGSPLIGVRLSLMESAGAFGFTGAGGSYRIWCKAGAYTLNVFMEGYEPRTEAISVNGNLTVNMALQPVVKPPPPLSEATITGKVTDAKTGLPVAGAIVMASSYGATTGQDGVYSLSVPTGTYNLTVTMKGYETQTLSVEASEEKKYVVDVAVMPLPPPPPPPTVKVTITLTATDSIYTEEGKPAVLTATVMKADGTWVAGVKVSFKSLGSTFYDDPNYPKGQFDSQTAVTNDAGVATVKWTCLEDLSGNYHGNLNVVFVASAIVDGQPIESKAIVYIASEPCSACH